MTQEHVEVLGKLPLEWRERWEKETRREWFADDEAEEDVHRSIKSNTTKEKRSWEDRFEDFIQEPRREKGMEEMGEEEKIALFEILRSMFRFKSQKGATSKEILYSQWMKKWALPDLENLGQRGKSD